MMSWLYGYNTIVPDLLSFLGIEALAQTVDNRLSFSPPTENLGTTLNCTMHFNSFNQNQPCTALVVLHQLRVYTTIAAVPVYTSSEVGHEGLDSL